METMATRDDVTVRIDTGLRAKARELDINMSRLFEDALGEEIERVGMRAWATSEAKYEIRLDLEDQEGRAYVGKFTGKLLGETDRVSVYLTDDSRLIVYDTEKLRHWDDVDVGDLQDWFPHDQGVYVDVMHALGEKPEVDI